MIGCWSKQWQNIFNFTYFQTKPPGFWVNETGRMEADPPTAFLQRKDADCQQLAGLYALCQCLTYMEPPTGKLACLQAIIVVHRVPQSKLFLPKETRGKVEYKWQAEQPPSSYSSHSDIVTVTHCVLDYHFEALSLAFGRCNIVFLHPAD